MPNKKLTDNEIINALKTLLELVLYEGCPQRAKTINLALDLINRQKADINQYKDLLDIAEIKFKKDEAKIERLEKQKDKMVEVAKHFKEEYEKVLNHYFIDTQIIGEGTPKQKVLKEFAERLKKHFTIEFCGQKYDLIHGWIDNLLIEMESADNG